jgi:carbon monoxide dehydrogenase subunit G
VAIDLNHRFTVPASIQETWAALNDLERIAPCFPGAALTSYDGDEFAGLVKVKLGPISLQYTGTGRFVERDEEARRAVIEARGKDKRGNGTAAAVVTAQLSDGDAGVTQVEVATALNVTGKPAQFGRGVMQEVSDKLLGQFTTCLSTKLAPNQPAPSRPVTAGSEISDASGRASAEPGPARSEPGSAPSRPVAAGLEISDASGRASAEPGPARSEPGSTRPDALGLGTTVVPILLRRYAPYLAGIVLFVVAVLVRRRLRR